MSRIDGKCVLVTGGARGIGLAMARAFAREGANLALTDVAEEPLEAACRELKDTGRRIWSHRLDVTNRSEIDEVREAVLEEMGSVDILVNNAGVVFGGPFLEVPWEKHRLTYEVNTVGLVAMTHAFLPDIVAGEEGHLVNVASASGLIGLPMGATYASSKWSVIGFSESIRLELLEQGHRHVGVTAVCPSYVATGMFDGARPPLTTRMLTPERLADLVVSAVQRNQRAVLAPWVVKVTPMLKGLLPGALFDMVSSAIGATSSMQQWKGHADEKE